MILTSIAFLLIIPIILIFSVGVPVVIGICVYKDANKREDCNPVLWALVAALVPSCIGLVVYLIIRRDYPLKADYTKRDSYASAGSKTPSGTGGTEEGSTYYQAGYEGEPINIKKDDDAFPTWAKAVIIIVAVVIGVCILGLIASVAFTVVGGTPSLYYHNF